MAANSYHMKQQIYTNLCQKCNEILLKQLFKIIAEIFSHYTLMNYVLKLDPQNVLKLVSNESKFKHQKYFTRAPKT
jgi:hypothetical protein